MPITGPFPLWLGVIFSELVIFKELLVFKLSTSLSSKIILILVFIFGYVETFSGKFLKFVFRYFFILETFIFSKLYFF